MIWGMTTSTFTALHVVISLIGIVTGLIVLYGLLTAKRLDGWTAIFLLTTVLTSVTGFGFPFEHLLPSHKVGIISLVLLAIAILARYALHMAGAWRWIYVVFCDHGSLSQLLRPGCAELREGPGAESDGPTRPRPSPSRHSWSRRSSFWWCSSCWEFWRSKSSTLCVNRRCGQHTSARLDRRSRDRLRHDTGGPSRAIADADA